MEKKNYREKIVELLQEGAKSFEEIQEAIGIGENYLRHILNELRRYDVIESQRVKVVYRLKYPSLEKEKNASQVAQ